LNEVSSAFVKPSIAIVVVNQELIVVLGGRMISFSEINFFVVV
jgi:hypothetical protein